ncbi:hypothetical protein WALSEDRAFT_69732 [Wallemia mellicola CBS 633.66]|uniref:F-box domain-containing protein n=2 Tax=Wallemia mellicola TaxID=1708541 RepID=I4Y9D7_WALMC|nr:hypothetical protein WALSEDRAFT_69732 [Wallemia mellicola CBS 633.66]TIB90848.1 hypothetical protein E3Q19_02605 [Wallemia mellicola]EIM20579.1 hypothetical protein WALSEDRAFT_69732 [Wallemia mellicola CBS 633.66]TIC27061.1 hypothetical protein E3Q11_02759 [Wallemia mellicola]TIC65737.1 hypothetical protein E3Q02_02067 [Wallemia mellicola]TIC73766.1 hypothetical protein E3Q00_02572 [Wallemia mellicola]|eukprot:XP_006959369.1 hypothetical protein WALSEDRAFT_69732 [Wallemia mellicola CBS 633.66]
MNNLPIELVYNLIEPLASNHDDLLPTLLINKDFSLESYKLLYSFVAFRPWQRPDKIIQYFDSIETNPRLAHLTRHLEVRSFPRQLNYNEKQLFYQKICTLLSHFKNLEICSWTRAFSLTTDILLILSKLPKLAELELNAGNQLDYDIIFNSDWNTLNTLKIILPNRDIVVPLHRFLLNRGQQLRSLVILAKESSVIDDNYIAAISKSLCNLRQLTLGGFKRVTEKGLSRILLHNNRLRSLCLESLNFSNVSWDIYLPELEHLTITFSTPETISRLLDLTRKSTKFRSFTIYSSGMQSLPYLPEEFITRLLAMHAKSLSTIRIHHVLISQDALVRLSQHCEGLTELVVHLPSIDIALILTCASKWRRLERLHLLGEPSDNDIHADSLLPLAKECKNLTQIGWRSRVWKVVRHGTDISLDLYKQIYIPSVFSVCTILSSDTPTKRV